MTNDAARTILQFMIDGIDPITGEILPPDNLCCQPDVIAALSHALSALPEQKTDIPQQFIRKNGKLNAGRPWTSEDNAALTELYASGRSVDEICALLQRRVRGVNRQLAYLGLTQSTSVQSDSRPRRAGAAWTPEEDAHLRTMHAARQPISVMAEKFQRSEYAIFCRMEKLELYGDVDGYPSRS